MGEVTHDQANLLLRLYELRREPRMREAREWFAAKFRPSSYEELSKQTLEENASMRMVVSYWEMAANMVNRGLIDEEFFFENTGEQWMVWERIKPVVAAMRERSKNPHQFESLEKHVGRMEAWREERAPGSIEAMRKFMAQMQQATQSKTASD